MKPQHKRSEQGQVLVIVVAAIVALLGFVALAVDGGLAYVDRRSAQNASDAGSLAGAWQIAYALEEDIPVITYSNWNCGLAKLDAARAAGANTAIGQVDINNFTIDTDVSDFNGVTSACYEIDKGSYVDKYIDVTVHISSGFDTAFAGMVGTDSITNTVTAVTRIRPRTELAFGYAIVALNPAACSGNQNGGVFSGNSNTYVTGGGIFSNGCMKGVGSSTATTSGEPIKYVAEFFGNPNNFNPTPDQESEVIPASAVSVPTPNCANLPARTDSSSPLLPGRYTEIRINNGTWDFEPGLYCITDSSDQAFRINGGTVTGDNVTFYLENGGVTFNGNAQIILTSPVVPDFAPAIQSVLFYAANGNTSTLTLNGNSNSQFVGTVIAPSADIKINGTGNVNSYQSQFIGFNVEMTGTSDINIFYSPDQNYQTPALLNLQH